MVKPTLPHDSAPAQAQRLAAIYARVSTTEQADNGYSLPVQIDACQRFADSHGYTVPDPYILVDDYTGKSLNRPQLTVLRAAIRDRKIHAIITHDQDRLSRRLAHQMALFEEFEEAGVLFHCVLVPADRQTDEGQMSSNMHAVFAEYDRLKILRRTKNGLQQRAREGSPPAGAVTLGYRYRTHAGKKGGSYEIDPEEAALVREIFRWYVDEGLTMHAITLRLIEAGVPTPKARRRPDALHRYGRTGWHAETVRQILTNETYVGTLYWGKRKRVAGKSNPDKNTRWQPLPREAWIAIPVPPIIDPHTFQAAQEQVTRNAKQSTRNRKHDYLFVGARLRCGFCGGAMSGQCTKRGELRYRCTYRAYQGALIARHLGSCAAAPIETYVWEQVRQVLNNPAVLLAEVERRKGNTTSTQGHLDRDRQRYERQLAQCDKDLQRWEAAYLGEAIDLADFKGKKVEIAARRASAEQALSQLDEQQRVIEQVDLETTFLEAYCARLRTDVQTLSLENKRDALEALSITVTWRPDAAPDIEGSIPIAIGADSSRCIGANYHFTLTA